MGPAPGRGDGDILEHTVGPLVEIHVRTEGGVGVGHPSRSSRSPYQAAWGRSADRVTGHPRAWQVGAGWIRLDPELGPRCRVGGESALYSFSMRLGLDGVAVSRGSMRRMAVAHRYIGP